MASISDQINAAKDVLKETLPSPPDLDAQVTPDNLKQRLEWGEPALTIVDVRDRDVFNELRIQGAINMPQAELAQMAQGALARDRDIFVYGADDAHTTAAARTLRGLGFTRVAEIVGGLMVWAAINGPTEGRAA